jgi:hypothetical protein
MRSTESVSTLRAPPAPAAKSSNGAPCRPAMETCVDVADVKIGVQAVFEVQIPVRRFIRGDQFHRQLSETSTTNSVRDFSTAFAAGIAGSAEAHRHFAVGRRRFDNQFPFRDARESVRTVASRGPNHGKQTGTPPRIALPGGMKTSFCALMNSSGGSPFFWKCLCGDVRAVQINLPPC